jgi:iron complex outermembrane receptor protein
LVDQESGLPIQNYQGVRARFSGFEASGQVRLMQSAGSLDLGLKADLVRAVNQSLNEPLPRISPLRMGANLRYAQGPLTAHLGLDAYAAQNRVPVGSMVTAAYTLWHGGLGYRQKMELGSLNWFVRVDNLSNQWAYSASSILTSTAPGKAPLPGRSVKFGVVANF